MIVSNMPVTTMQLLCPRCGDLFEHPLRSALSRYHTGMRICSTCGHNEAMFGDTWTEGTIVERLQEECRERERECADYATQLSRLESEFRHKTADQIDLRSQIRDLRQQVRQLTAAVEGLASFDDDRPMEERLAELVGKMVEVEVDDPPTVYVGRLQHNGASNAWRLPGRLVFVTAHVLDVREVMEF